MAEPKIADRQPIKFELEEGKTYFWCSCGESSNQPLCDGSHKGSEFEPLKFTAEETKTAYLCMCKATSNPGFCDGSHNQLG